MNSRDEIVVTAAPNRDGIFDEYAEQRCMPRKDAELTIHGAREDDLSLTGPHHAVGRDKLNLHGGHSEILPAGDCTPACASAE